MATGTPRFTEDSADVLVFTFKEGLLSAVAHDLKIRVNRFAIHVGEGNAIEATFDARSLTVVTAMKDGADALGTLGDGDKKKIAENIADDVLHPKKHPEIRFASTSVEEDGSGTGYRVKGRLTLCGQTHEIAFVSRSDGEGQVAEIKLHQPTWGVKPFSAMLGALKIKPDVLVRVALPGAL
ncbi:MAG: YceI family protein [Polyangiaceae bacterium]